MEIVGTWVPVAVNGSISITQLAGGGEIYSASRSTNRNTWTATVSYLSRAREVDYDRLILPAELSHYTMVSTGYTTTYNV
jgi:hypothetical protein